MSNQELKQIVMNTILLGLTDAELSIWANEIAFKNRDLENYNPDEYEACISAKKHLIYVYKLLNGIDIPTHILNDAIRLCAALDVYDQDFTDKINGLEPEIQKDLEQRIKNSIED